ncbi:MAG: acyl-CoA dehydrogenase [Myxococcota bacterium]|jgi:acyl-CoA dehydrogenase
MSAIERGRAELVAWMAAQPDNLCTDDTELQALLEHHGLLDRMPSLERTGAAVAGPLDEAARTNNRHHNLPRYAGWDGVGQYTAAVDHHPSWREAGKIIYGTGIMAAYGETVVPHRYILSLFYLTAQAGEAGHNCPLACDAGAIRALQALGTDKQKDQFLYKLLDPDFDTNFTASQFLTEVQGGSDVGANAVEARQDGEGRWVISGEKWFCSNADADVFLMTARVEGQGKGTRGLGLFVVPRVLEDGSLNGFRIRRLKDKLGTRSMASAEIDFDHAVAEPLGAPEQGFRNVIRLVITTSRLYNAFGCAGHARRAWAVASTYAQHRSAFGQPIGRFAEVAETLAWIRADAVASLASSLWLAGFLERQEAGELSREEEGFFRMAVNLNKMWTAKLAHEAVNRGIEVLGGNGAIESFSVLPRLLRDNVVYENWEGTHNVLCAQVLRDARRLGVHEGFFAVLAERLGEKELAVEAAAFEALLGGPVGLAGLRMRRLAPRLATLTMLAAMAPVEALSSAAEMTRRHLWPHEVDEGYLALVESLQRHS